MYQTLHDIRSDPGTPSVQREIADVFLDMRSEASPPIPFPNLVRRLLAMAKSQMAGGHAYYAAISVHNASIAELVAGNPAEAIRLAELALEHYDALSYPASERYSTHAVLATGWLELGDVVRAEEHIRQGLSSGGEHGDVHAEFALLFALTGDHSRAEAMLLKAEVQRNRGLSDLQADEAAAIAHALLSLSTNPGRALEVMLKQTRDRPLDVGDSLAHDALVSLSMLMARKSADASRVARRGLERARAQLARGPEVRLAMVAAMADGDMLELRTAIADSAAVGNLALLQIADAIGEVLHLLTPVPPQLETSIRTWPRRWLPVLRRQLQKGNQPTSRVAALLLDDHGELEDVVRLRAFAKAYSRRGRISSQLGRSLAKRVGPKLEIFDLGRARLRIHDRAIDVSAMRRKPASLLLYLVTRPSLTATRDEILDQLWPDTAPGSAANSLNQSLYYLRRDIDPWYEDNLSIEYVPYEGELVWLDPDLVSVASLKFLESTRDATSYNGFENTMQVLEGYGGQFAPEFEYEDWAITWRSRLQVAFLEFSQRNVDVLVARGALAEARDVAVKVLDVEPDARDVERKLIALFWRLGSRAAARAQYAHFAALERADGFDPPSFEAVCSEELPGTE